MQITIVQSEIEQAIKQFVLGRLNVDGPQDVAIELKATRGETGMQAVIDITLGAEKPTPSRPAQRVMNGPAKPVPVITTADLKRMHAEEEAAEAAAEGASTEAATEEEEALPAAEEEAVAIPENEGEAAVVEEAQAPAPVAPAPAPKPAPAPAQAPVARPAAQVAGAAPGPAGAPPKRLFAGFARPNNTGA
jgi:hypothetical protein